MIHRWNLPQNDPREVQHHVRLSDGRKLACLALGNPEDSPVLYFHGYPGSRLEGRLAADAVRRFGLWLLAPDRPGFGESTFQPDRTIGGWAADMAELADRLALERFDVVGVSGGGPYALACAARIPERINHVALVGALGPLGRKSLTREMVTLNRLALMLAAHMPPLARLAVGLAARLIRKNPERYLERMMSAAPPSDREVFADPVYRALFAESTAEALRQGGCGVGWELTLLARPWDFNLREISMPVQIWQGLDDNIVPVAMARHLAATLPGSEPHYLADEGHLSLIVRHLSVVLADLQRKRRNPPMTNQPLEQHNDRREDGPETIPLEIDEDGSPVTLEPGSWFVCFVPGLQKQWWHRFVNKRHKHVFAMRPEKDGEWTLFEPWWHRLLTATITSEQARKFLLWGARGDVLLVREAIPGRGSQVRGWMTCATLSSYLLGRKYWVWTPHGLYKLLLREPNVCRVDVSALLERDLSSLAIPDSRVVVACSECSPDAPKPPGAFKPFCMKCGRDLDGEGR